jgi:hypothetical protein
MSLPRRYVRTVPHPASHPVDLVALSSVGLVALYSHTDQTLHATTINLRHDAPPLASATAGERLSALLYARSASVLLTAGDAGVVVLRSATDLTVLHRLDATYPTAPSGPGPLRSLAMPAGEEVLMAGSHQGNLLVWSLPQRVERDALNTFEYLTG